MHQVSDNALSVSTGARPPAISSTDTLQINGGCLAVALATFSILGKTKQDVARKLDAQIDSVHDEFKRQQLAQKQSAPTREFCGTNGQEWHPKVVQRAMQAEYGSGGYVFKKTTQWYSTNEGLYIVCGTLNRSYVYRNVRRYHAGHEVDDSDHEWRHCVALDMHKRKFYCVAAHSKLGLPLSALYLDDNGIPDPERSYMKRISKVYEVGIVRVNTLVKKRPEPRIRLPFNKKRPAPKYSSSDTTSSDEECSSSPNEEESSPAEPIQTSAPSIPISSPVEQTAAPIPAPSPVEQTAALNIPSEPAISPPALVQTAAPSIPASSPVVQTAAPSIPVESSASPVAPEPIQATASRTSSPDSDPSPQRRKPVAVRRNQKPLDSDKYSTPLFLLALIASVFGATFDPCPIDWTSDMENGLESDWLSKGLTVFCNPPYSRLLVNKFITKAYKEALRGCDVIMLLNAITDKPIFHELILDKAEVIFLPKRLKFLKNGLEMGPNPKPSMLCIYSKNKEKIEELKKKLQF